MYSLPQIFLMHLLLVVDVSRFSRLLQIPSAMRKLYHLIYLQPLAKLLYAQDRLERQKKKTNGLLKWTRPCQYISTEGPHPKNSNNCSTQKIKPSIIFEKSLMHETIISIFFLTSRGNYMLHLPKRYLRKKKKRNFRMSFILFRKDQMLSSSVSVPLASLSFKWCVFLSYMT